MVHTAVMPTWSLIPVKIRKSTHLMGQVTVFCSREIRFSHRIADTYIRNGGGQ